MLLRNALDGGENGLMILAMVARQLRLLLRTKKLKSAGVARQNFARELRIPPFMVDALTGQSERYGERELCLGIESASKADILIKSSRLSPGVILDQLLVQLLTTDEALA